MRLFTRIMLLGGLAFLGYANLDMLDSSVNLIRKVQVEVTAGIEMRNICRAVVMHYVNTGEIPLRNFSRFLRENMVERGGKEIRDHSKDMWGTPYAIAVKDVEIIVMSAGPDKTWRTEDDLYCSESLAKVEIPNRVRADIRRALYGESSQATGGGARRRPGQPGRQQPMRTPQRPVRGGRRRRFHAPSGWQF